VSLYKDSIALTPPYLIPMKLQWECHGCRAATVALTERSARMMIIIGYLITYLPRINFEGITDIVHKMPMILEHSVETARSLAMLKFLKASF
jgi:hypothetical protein